MPVQHGADQWYSVGELAHFLKADESAVARLLWVDGLRREDIAGVGHLHRADLDRFFRTFQAAQAIPESRHALPEWLEGCSAPWAVTLTSRYREPYVYPTALSPTQGDLLRTLVANIAPRTAVEIGSYVGISTLWLAAGLDQGGSNGLLHAIDLFGELWPFPPYRYAYVPDLLHLARESARAAQLDQHIRFHQGDSQEVGKRLGALLDGPIDFLYIDGDHTAAGCLADFLLYYPHVAVGGYIAFHDINPAHCGCTGPRQVLDAVVKPSPTLALVELPTTPENYGIALVRKLGVDRQLLTMPAADQRGR